MTNPTASGPTCPDCHRPRGTEGDDGITAHSYCWRDMGRQGALIDCQRAQIARLTTARAVASARAGEAIPAKVVRATERLIQDAESIDERGFAEERDGLILARYIAALRTGGGR